MTKEELQELIEKRVGPNPSHSELIEHVRRQEKLLDYIFAALGQQARSLLEQRDKLVDHTTAIESIANVLGAEPDDGSVIELPKPPTLVGFH
ncbi:MAG: hypothetical protein ACJ8FS_16580 [Sphingomicrobium sp.]